MKTPTVLMAGLLALGLLGCAPATTPLQSGGSGDTDNAMIGSAAPYGTYAPYDTSSASTCAPWDQNCTIIYDSPGGGD